MDVRTSLNAKLPRDLFLQKDCLMVDWLISCYTWWSKAKFLKSLIKTWQKEVRVQLKHCSKPFCISKADCIIRVKDYLTNIWSIRWCFLEKCGIDLPITNGDQIPLQWKWKQLSSNLSIQKLGHFRKRKF